MSPGWLGRVHPFTISKPGDARYVSATLLTCPAQRRVNIRELMQTGKEQVIDGSLAGGRARGRGRGGGKEAAVCRPFPTSDSHHCLLLNTGHEGVRSNEVRAVMDGHDAMYCHGAG